MTIKKKPKSNISINELKKENKEMERFKNLEMEDEQEEHNNDEKNELQEVEINPNLNFNTDILIDIHNLEFEWMRQPQLVMSYSEMATKLEAIERKLKRSIDVKRSQLDTECRTNAANSGDKITEGIVKAYVEEKSAELKEVKQLDKITYQLSMVKNALKALEHKKKALEWISQLYLSGYFSTPKEKRISVNDKKISDYLHDRMRDRQREILNEE
jgi:hypothetical protein